MFSKISRYRKLPNIVTLDARSRTLESKSLRLTPHVPGQIQHILEGSDRLDQLAYKYYRQPRNWWRICDANADFDDPRALIGKAVELTGHFHLVRSGTEPYWPELRRDIAGLQGVITVKFGTDEDPHPVVEIVREPKMFGNLDPALAADLDEAVSTQQLPAALVTELETRGVSLSSKTRISREDSQAYQLTAESVAGAIYGLPLTSASLVFAEQDGHHHTPVWTRPLSDELVAELEARGMKLPPDIGVSIEDIRAYQLADSANWTLYLVRMASGALVLAEQDMHHHWTAEITFNRMIVTADELCEQISTLQCEVSEPQLIGRIGKPIAIPRNVQP